MPRSDDCVLIATDHSTYDYHAIAPYVKLVVDMRNATRRVKQNRKKLSIAKAFSRFQLPWCKARGVRMCRYSSGSVIWLVDALLLRHFLQSPRHGLRKTQ